MNQYFLRLNKLRLAKNAISAQEDLICPGKMQLARQIVIGLKSGFAQYSFSHLPQFSIYRRYTWFQAVAYRAKDGRRVFVHNSEFFLPNLKMILLWCAYLLQDLTGEYHHWIFFSLPENKKKKDLSYCAQENSKIFAPFLSPSLFLHQWYTYNNVMIPGVIACLKCLASINIYINLNQKYNDI